jgi:2-hydroxy-6-oxonona-2,4-dienedioate hydrolase
MGVGPFEREGQRYFMSGYRSVWGHLMNTAFRQAWLDVGGLKTRCVEAGDPAAPPLLLLHGMGGTWEAFCANIPAYAEQFHVIAFDMVGCGYTDKPDRPLYSIADYVDHVVAVMDAFGVDTADFVGVSLGSWIASRFALQYPERVRKIAMCAPSGLWRDTPAGTAVAAKLKDDRMRAVLDPSWHNVEKVYEDLIHDPENRSQDLINVRVQTYRLEGAIKAMESVLAITLDDNYQLSAIPDDDWRTLKSPVLIIESVDDSPHFRRNAERLVHLLPHGERVTMTEVAHWPQFEKFNEFNRITTDFFLKDSRVAQS